MLNYTLDSYLYSRINSRQSLLFATSGRDQSERGRRRVSEGGRKRGSPGESVEGVQSGRNGFAISYESLVTE